MEEHREDRRCGREKGRSRKNKELFEKYELNLRVKHTPGGILRVEDFDDPTGAYVIVDLKKQFLKRIFVDKKRRGKNIGEFLILKMMEECRNFNIDKLTFWNVNEGFWDAMSRKYSYIFSCNMADYGCIILKEEIYEK